MTYNFTVSPDFSPDLISGWYIFNTWMQRMLGDGIHLELYNDFETQRKAIDDGKVDLIYANAFDASSLVRDKGFVSLVSPAGQQSEATIAVSAESDVQKIEDLKPGIRIAQTSTPDVNMICMIMLEPADLKASDTEQIAVDSYVLVAKQLIQGKADVGFFLKDAYENMSSISKQNLRPLITSEISVVNHTLLAGPGANERLEDLRTALLSMNGDEKGQSVLKSLGISAWNPVSQDDIEFMIDLMDTLQD